MSKILDSILLSILGFFCVFCFTMRHVLAQGTPGVQQPPVFQPQTTEPAQTPQNNLGPPPPQGNQFPDPIRSITPAAGTTGFGVAPVFPVSGTPGVSTTATGRYSEYQPFCLEPLKTKTSDEETAKKKANALDQYQKTKSFSNFSIALDILLENNQTKEAINLLSQEKSQFTALQQTLLQARIWVQQKRFREATDSLNKLTADKKDQVSLLNEYFNAYHAQGNYFEARSALEDILKIETKGNYPYLLKLCILDSEDSNHKEAELNCNRASKMNPDDPMPLMYLGFSYRDSTDYDKSISQFVKANSLKKSEFTLSCIGEILLIEKKYDLAKRFFEQALKFESTSGRANYGLAKIYYEQKKYDEALPFYSKACEYDKQFLQKFKEAYRPLETEKLKISNEYFQQVQKCVLRF